MAVNHLHREQLVARPLDEVAEFFSNAGNLALLTPASMRFQLITPQPVEMRDGALIEYRLRVHGVPIRWVSRIENWRDGAGFDDRQLRGPYKHWRHRHSFEAVDGGTRVTDDVEYELPLGPLGALAGGLMVRRDLGRIFDFRRDTVRRLLG